MSLDNPLTNEPLKSVPPADDRDSDRSLLQEFAKSRDENAFATIVERHGPMVFSVCHRILGDRQTAEDAYQATFLVLANKAAVIRQPDMLAGWLYGVAKRAAWKARKLSKRRGNAVADEVQIAARGADPLDELSAREALSVLQEEVDRLPSAYRLPVVLCTLEGLTIEEAAMRLNTSVGALRGKLQRGRATLRHRLELRGFAPAVVLGIVALAQVANASCGLPLHVITQGACHFAACPSTLAVVVPAVPKMLTDWVLNSMLVSKLKVAGYGILSAAIGLGPLSYGTLEHGTTSYDEVAAVTSRKRDQSGDAWNECDKVALADNDRDWQFKLWRLTDKDGRQKLGWDHQSGGEHDKDGNPKRTQGIDKEGRRKQENWFHYGPREAWNRESTLACAELAVLDSLTT